MCQACSRSRLNVAARIRFPTRLKAAPSGGPSPGRARPARRPGQCIRYNSAYYILFSEEGAAVRRGAASRRPPAASPGGRPNSRACQAQSRSKATQSRSKAVGDGMSDEVLVERRGAVQVIIINRPEARDALNGAVAAGIRDAVDELDADGELRAGVLTGAGGTFSSGMDLKAFLRGESPSIPGRGLCGITQTPPRKPLGGAAEGWALAGG